MFRPSPQITFGDAFATACYVAAFCVLISAGQDIYAFATGNFDTAPRIWMFDLDAERSVFTWLSTLLLAGAAIMAMLVANAESRIGSVRSWFWLGIFLLMALASMDEAISLHEKVDEILSRKFEERSGLFHFAWAIPAGICALIGLALMWPFFKSLPFRTSALLVSSALIFLLGAVGIEAVSGLIIQESSSVFVPGYRALMTIEEALEVTGVLLFIHTTAGHLEYVIQGVQRSNRGVRRGDQWVRSSLSQRGG